MNERAYRSSAQPMGGVLCPTAMTSPHLAFAPAVTGLILDLDGTLTKQGAIDFDRIRRRIGMPDGMGSILHWVERDSKTEVERTERVRIVVEEEKLGLERMELNDGFHLLAAFIAARGESISTAICTRNGAYVASYALSVLLYCTCVCL
jgi:hypothetical protein